MSLIWLAPTWFHAKEKTFKCSATKSTLIVWHFISTTQSHRSYGIHNQFSRIFTQRNRGPWMRALSTLSLSQHTANAFMECQQFRIRFKFLAFYDMLSALHYIVKSIFISWSGVNANRFEIGESMCALIWSVCASSHSHCGTVKERCAGALCCNASVCLMHSSAVKGCILAQKFKTVYECCWGEYCGRECARARAHAHSITHTLIARAEHPLRKTPLTNQFI